MSNDQTVELWVNGPREWSDSIRIKKAVMRDGIVQWLEDEDFKPDFYRLYAREPDDTLRWLVDCVTEQQALDMVEQLAHVFELVSDETPPRKDS